jgi:hypothetical protein
MKVEPRGFEPLTSAVQVLAHGFLALGLTRFREPIRVKRSSSMKGAAEVGQERQAVSA